MAHNELKSRIAELRDKVGLTQRELAAIVGVTETTIANWERGRRAIEFIDKLIRLCDALQCDIRELIEQPSIDLREVNLANTDFQGKDLSKAQLQRANLSGALLQGAKLVNAQLMGTNLQQADLENANLQNANLEGANLTGANLKRANLEGACLKKADLSHADLRESNAQEANFEGAKVRKAMLSGANLKGTHGLSYSEADSIISPLIIGGIPDQDFARLSKMYSRLADYLQRSLGVEVESYESLTNNSYAKTDQNYESTVTAFRLGNIDLVWLGGFTLIQALDQAPDAKVIAQRDIDRSFRTVFIANGKNLATFLEREHVLPWRDEDPEVLRRLCQKPKKLKFTFSAKSSTSGDLIPLHYLVKAGLRESDFQEVRFSGSHDATIRLVTSGVYDVGALSQQVWLSRINSQELAQERLVKIWQSPSYQNYAWLVHANVIHRHGLEMVDKLQKVLLQLQQDEQEGKAILELFGATEFIKTDNLNYGTLKAIVQERSKDEAFFWNKDV